MVNRKMRIALVAPCMLVVGAFAGASAAGNVTYNGDIADLFYDSDSGNVWVNAREAGGGVVTSFQFENDAGTFIPGNYVGPTNGLYGGLLEDVTTKVIADTDFSFVGFGGTHRFGQIFPAGMNQAQLEAYLTTAVYTGALGTGQEDIDLRLLPSADTDGDGDVDTVDYIAVKAHMGQPSAALLADGDLDGDGNVDLDDLQILQYRFGVSSPAGGAVPEPATLGLLAFGAMAVIRRRRR